MTRVPKQGACLLYKGYTIQKHNITQRCASILWSWEYNHDEMTQIPIELPTSHGYIPRAHKMNAQSWVMLWST